MDLLASELSVGVATFSELSADDIARTCGRSLEHARLMKLREYDESFCIVPPDATARTRLLQALHETGLRCVSCGDHEHVNAVIDRTAGIERLRSLFEHAHGGPILTIGLGNSLSDLPLLKAVDLPIVVRDDGSASTVMLLRKVPRARMTSRHGAHGWSHAVLDVGDAVQQMRQAASGCVQLKQTVPRSNLLPSSGWFGRMALWCHRR